MVPEFANEPLTDFSNPSNRQAMQTALQHVKAEFGREWLLFKTAALMRAKKHLFSATMVYEAGKTWPEADADTAEAIDFLEYYGREAVRLAQPQPLSRVAGEDNELVYLPLGVGVIIPPWNFPLAIMAGMASAAVVTGNA